MGAFFFGIINRTCTFTHHIPKITNETSMIKIIINHTRHGIFYIMRFHLTNKTKKQMKKQFFFSFLSLLLFLTPLSSQQIYKNPNIPIEERIDDLISQMTLEEKFWQLYMIPGDLEEGKEKYKNGIFGFQVATAAQSGNETEQMLRYSAGSNAYNTAIKINEIQRYFVEETRLGIPIIPFDEALHGLVRNGATAFPQSIALAATWDTALMMEVGQAIAMETKSRGIRQILSPVLNIARDVRWGRTEETYGEDPFLTSQMGYAYISQLENNGIIATPKHFIANVGDGGRDSYPIHYNDRLLKEIYYPAFKYVFEKAGTRSVMTSYNSLDGSPCTANEKLLKDVLKKQWGFQGFVISDAGATGGANVLHFTAEDYATATQQAIENGLDVIFQTSYDHFPLFYEAFEKGMINMTLVDEAVRRVLRAKFELGLFENPYVEPQEAEKWNANQTHLDLAKKVAQKSIVLLKNEHQLLPLDMNYKSIAVIGTDATEARLGGYSGPGSHPISILEGIKQKIGDGCEIGFAPGCGRTAQEFIPVPAENLFHKAGNITKPGLKAQYFNNIQMKEAPELERIDPQINFSWTLFSPQQDIIHYDFYSVCWEGQIKASQSGLFRLGWHGEDGYRLFLNDSLLIDNWQKRGVDFKTVEVAFEKGKYYDLRVEFYETRGNVKLQLVWNMGVNKQVEERISEAVSLTKKSDMAIVVVGTEEGEFRDRSHLNLPGHQEEMIQQVAAAGKPMVVILVGGSAVTMENWIDLVPSILDVWYPGEQGGSAIADVLFGDENPAGRLPITFPMHEGQLPLYYNHKPTGRGDDYDDLRGKPLFPFGYGLSYTQFEYSDLILASSQMLSGDSLEVQFTLTNTGNYNGEEVVQFYLRDLLASVARPVIELKGFKRVFLKKGESRKLSFTITPEMLQMLNEDMEKVIEPGAFRLMIGASSNDIRLREVFEVEED
jgi:beta-glucosidase